MSDIAKPHDNSAGVVLDEPCIAPGISESPFAAFDLGPSSALTRIQNFLHANPTVIPLLVLAVGISVFAALVGARFFAPFNMSLILQQVTIIAIIGMAQTLIILTAGIDLSVGVIMILSSVVMGRLAVDNGVSLFIAFPLGMAVAVLCGVANGVLVALMKLPPFIATLGTLSIFGAINLTYSDAETIREESIAAAAPFLQFAGNTIDLPAGAVITYGTIVAALLCLFLWYLLNHTAFGRHIYAVGDNEIGARLAGISISRTLVSVYAVAGAICCIGGWVLTGRIGAISPIAGGTVNLDSVTAVVIGGTSLFGGRGSIVGTLIGALIVGVFRDGLALYGLNVIWQEFTVGVLIILAVTLDQWIRKISS